MNLKKTYDIPFFNLEISEYNTSLVFNANREGIDLFLLEYGQLKSPPPFISFTKWQRCQRRRKSYSVELNPHASPLDPTPYKAASDDGCNKLYSELEIQFLNDDNVHSILAVGFRTVPQLALNQKGWDTFLKMIRHLKDQSYWFFVTHPHHKRWNHLPFLLSSIPQAFDFEFLAIECIRLDPEDKMYLELQGRFEHDNLNDPTIDFRANSAGHLFLAHEILAFSNSNEESKTVFNPWNNIFESVMRTEPNTIQPPAQTFHFYKIKKDCPKPVLAMGFLEEKLDFCFFGNDLGFYEFEYMVESAAFLSDWRFFGSDQSENFHRPCYLTPEIDVSFPIHLAKGWVIYDGLHLNAQYDEIMGYLPPNKERRHFREILNQFINERICFEHRDS